MKFQSTLPAREATYSYALDVDGAIRISIHASRKGSDFLLA